MAPFPDTLLPIARRALEEAVPHVTRTLSQPPTLVQRQEAETVTVIVESGGGGGGTNLSSGALAGIVIGSIAGTLLLLWLVRSCFNLGAPPGERESWYHHTEPKRRHDHHHQRHSHRRRHSDGHSPPPVVVKERSRSRHQHPTYVYTESSPRRNSKGY